MKVGNSFKESNFSNFLIFTFSIPEIPKFRNCYLFSFLSFQAEVSMISWIICT